MQTIMIEPVGSGCNLRCVYCYQEPVRTIVEIMSNNILERIVPDEIALSDEIKLLWHGGEPTLAGINFFKKAVQFQKRFNKKGIKIVNAIQTNATLIDEEWAEFFAENDFRIGTSIDGPKELHDITRDGSYNRTIRGIKCIQDAGKGVGIIITVNKHNVDYPELIWNEVIKPKKISNSFEINICSSTELSSLTPSPDKSLDFMIKLFNLWIEKDDPEITIKTFRVILRFLLGGEAGDCAFEYNKCNQFAAIDEKGDVYICNRFMKREVAFLGNVSEQSLKDIVRSKKALKLYDKIAKIKNECRKCEWLMCCGGGCAFQRWLHTGRFDAGFPECDLRKKFFSHVKEKVAQI
ncbi:MAG: radical SAM protein [Patescibacteria group bacterium]